MENFKENIELRVFLLAIYKRESDESFKDVIAKMEEARVFNQKIGKKYLKQLKELGFVTEDGLTMIGIENAKNVEMEFKI
jgi:uncharacterized protein with HEPN domain